jgi:hypothetical protein
MVKYNAINMKYLILFLLVCYNVFSQNKVIVPTSGTIAFIKDEKMYDKDLYIKSFIELKPKMIKSMMNEIYFERLTDGNKTDTLILKAEVEKRIENLEMMLSFLFNQPKKEIIFYHEFISDKITQYYTIDGLEFGNRIIINTNTLEIKDENADYVEIEENEIVKLTEFKNETKIINGFNCFKVVYSYKSKNKGFIFFDSNTRELWVTKEIKTPFHPVLRDNELLEKYYPLEIIEYSDEIKGMKTVYSIDKVTLQ